MDDQSVGAVPLKSKTMSFSTAMLAGVPMANHLSKYCDRLEFAGSVRRQALQVSDIEIVAVPTIAVERNLLGEVIAEFMLIDDWLAQALAADEIVVTKNGPRWKQFWLQKHGPQFDLFLVRPPAQWGVILALRTGPAEYSRWLVTKKPFGACPPDLQFKSSGIYHKDVLIPTPEEKDVFDLLGQPLLPPHARKVP